jgi:anti-sigma B factor antagonist
MFIEDILIGEARHEAERAQKTLYVSPGSELTETTAPEFRRLVQTGLDSECRRLDVDLSKTLFIDSCGLGALIWLRKIMLERRGTLRLVQPSLFVQEVLALTRLNRIFESTP